MNGNRFRTILAGVPPTSGRGYIPSGCVLVNKQITARTDGKHATDLLFDQFNLAVNTHLCPPYSCRLFFYSNTRAPTIRDTANVTTPETTKISPLV